MREIVNTLLRNAHEVRYGSASVELSIHDGRIVKAIFKTSRTEVGKNQSIKTEDKDE